MFQQLFRTKDSHGDLLEELLSVPSSAPAEAQVAKSACPRGPVERQEAPAPPMRHAATLAAVQAEAAAELKQTETEMHCQPYAHLEKSELSAS